MFNLIDIFNAQENAMRIGKMWPIEKISTQFIDSDLEWHIYAGPIESTAIYTLASVSIVVVVSNL